ncbi:hypothetical protein ACUOAQ_22530, partial [Escherichia sp. SP-MK]
IGISDAWDLIISISFLRTSDGCITGSWQFVTIVTGEVACPILLHFDPDNRWLLRDFLFDKTKA